MKFRSRCTGIAIVLAATLAAGSGVLHANGLPFFKPANGGKVDLVYVGQIKDREGNLLRNVELSVATTNRFMYEITFDQDGPGHYRSPDVGVLVKEAYQAVNPNEITIVARKYGYRTVIRKVPLRTSGTLRVDIWMSPDDGQAPVVEEAPPAIEEKTSSDVVFFGVGALAIGLIGVAARRASRRQSTADSAPATA
jgi:hypothetical protein